MVGNVQMSRGLTAILDYFLPSFSRLVELIRQLTLFYAHIGYILQYIYKNVTFIYYFIVDITRDIFYIISAKA
jgi:hypothetical protein